MKRCAKARCLVLVVVGSALAACSTTEKPGGPAGTGGSGQSAEGPGGIYKLGKPYAINGRWYYPEYDPRYRREGIASWYGSQFDGLATANGETFDKEEISAAHPTLPLPSRVRVTNLDNQRSLVVRVNDRGPFVGDRLIDLSQAAARELGYEQQGLAHVRVEFLDIAEARGTPPTPTMVASNESTRANPPAPAPATIAGSERTPPSPLRPAPIAVASIDRAPVDPPSTAEPPLVRAASVSGDPRAGGQAQIIPATAVTNRDGPSASRPVMVASFDAPAKPRTCIAGPQFIQVGAFSDTEHVRVAQARLASLQSIRTEPVFVNNHAAIRVRLGPVANSDAADRLLAKVRAQGYGEAFAVPANQSVPVVRCQA